MNSLQHGQGNTRLNVGFILAQSFTLSAFSLFVDMLRLGGEERDAFGKVRANWQVLGSTKNPISSSCGVKVAPTSNFVDPTQFDYIVVVGGMLATDRPVDKQTIAFLQKAGRMRIPLIGVCTGTFILAEAGLMKYHQTCVNWRHYQEFRERFPNLEVRTDRTFHLDRIRGSCVGGSSSSEMAAFLVGRHIGKSAARNACEILLMDKGRAPLDTQPRRLLHLSCNDPRVDSVLNIMERHIEDTISLAVLADSVGLSRRQLERLFLKTLNKSPGQVYRELRLERAKLLLKESKAPLTEIATEVGFKSASHFVQLFRTTYGKTPNKLRMRETLLT